MTKQKTVKPPAVKPGIAVPRNPPVPPPRVDWIPHVIPPRQDKDSLKPPVAPAGDPVRRRLTVLPGVCVGCQLCELACSLTHEGVINPYLARLKVTQIREEGIVEPNICRHCDPAPCEQACSQKALFLSPSVIGVLVLDKDKCTQCHECLEACPFGAIYISPQGHVLKCDLCGGNPACVSVCQDRPEFHPPDWGGEKISALAFAESQDSTRVKRRRPLRKHEE